MGRPKGEHGVGLCFALSPAVAGSEHYPPALPREQGRGRDSGTGESCGLAARHIPAYSSEGEAGSSPVALYIGTGDLEKESRLPDRWG